MLEGIIVKGYSGFYYVQADTLLWECSLRGKYRIKEQNFLVGDRVLIKPVNDTKAVIEKVLERHCELKRPPVANVEQAVIVMSMTKPSPDFMLLDRLLVLVEYQGLDVVICFNKQDLTAAGLHPYGDVYEKIGYRVIFASAKTGAGVATLKERLKGRVSVLAGPSGVGKSSLLNAIQPGLALRTGQISAKTGRGRHTTRHVELLQLTTGGFVADTPGFSRLDLPQLPLEDLAFYFPEIAANAQGCRFASCLHVTEPGCQVRDAVATGLINEQRYANYCYFLDEIKQKGRRY